MKVPNEIRLDPGEVRQLSQVQSWRGALAIASDWALIFGAATLCWHYWHPVLYLVTVAFVGARQHDLLILAHEAAHYRLFRRRSANDLLAEICVAWPFMVGSIASYRRNHIRHHARLNTGDDPDLASKTGPQWQFPMSRARMAGMLLADICGLGLVRTGRAMKRFANHAPTSTSRLRTRLVFAGGLLATVHVLGLWVPFLLFWVIPFMTWAQLALHIRSLAEHFAIPGGDPVFGGTRTVKSTWLDRLFIARHPVGLHMEHHLYPSVPLYHLHALHRALMRQPTYRNNLHISPGYVAVLREAVAK